MRASEVAAKLLEIAKEHNDPHVYALGSLSAYVQAVEPYSIQFLELGFAGSAVVIAGQTMAEVKEHEMIVSDPIGFLKQIADEQRSVQGVHSVLRAKGFNVDSATGEVTSQIHGTTFTGQVIEESLPPMSAARRGGIC